MQTRYLTFRDLKNARICSNRTQLSRLIANYGFPSGFLMTSNARRWTEEEVSDWVDARRALSGGEGRQ